MAYPGDPNRERRATDGLDWRSREPEPPPRPADTDDPRPGGGEPPAAGGRPSLGLVAAVAAAAALAGGIVGGLLVALLAGDEGEEPVRAVMTTATPPGPTPPAPAADAGTVAAVVARARPSVVRIESTRQANGGTEQDVGSGVIIDREGHVITNAHVVLGTETLRVILADGTERPAILVGHDYPFTDLAVLQIGPGGIEPIAVGDADALQLGETVVAIGNPLAEFDGSVSVGVISGLNRVRVFDAVRQDDLIQTDAALNSGNSGGALLNLAGEFIGMPTAVLRESRGGAPVEGIAFALPSNRILPIARGIIAAQGRYPRPATGLDHLDLSPEVADRVPGLAVQEGALVVGIEPGGPAATAGIETGDVITRLGDAEITRELPFMNALMAHEPGESVRVVLNRDGQIIEVEVRLETWS